MERYLVNVTGLPGFNCPPDQCNVTTTNTTITGLKCNTSYMVTVRAVNCIGEGTPTDATSVRTHGKYVPKNIIIDYMYTGCDIEIFAGG